LIVLVITDETEENEASLKVVVVVEVVDVRFLLPFGLSRGLNVIMKDEPKGEKEKGGRESDGSEATVSLFFFFCLFLCLAFRSAAFAAVKARALTLSCFFF